MDVKLPNGQVITNVPEGTSKADLVAKLQRNGYDTSWYQPEPAQAPTVVTPPKVDELTAGLRGASQGVTLGFADEGQGLFGAALEAIHPSDPNDKRPWTQRFTESYSRFRDIARNEAAQAAHDQPGAYVAGQVAGAIPTAIATGNVVSPVAQGAIYGLGAGEGNLASQAKSAAIGAAVPLAIGAAAPVAKMVGEKLWNVSSFIPEKVGQTVAGLAQRAETEPGIIGSIARVTPKVRAAGVVQKEAPEWLARTFPNQFDAVGKTAALDRMIQGVTERPTLAGAQAVAQGGEELAKVLRNSWVASDVANSALGHAALNMAGKATGGVTTGISAVTGAGQAAGAAAGLTGKALENLSTQKVVTQPFTDLFKQLFGEEPESNEQVGAEFNKLNQTNPEVREALRNRTE